MLMGTRREQKGRRHAERQLRLHKIGKKKVQDVPRHCESNGRSMVVKMSDYISRDLAIQANVSQVEFCKAEGLSFSGLLHIDSVINNLKLVPAADVVEQKHGKWLDVPDPDEMYVECECSECHERYFKFHSSLDFKWIPYNFCPNCGARMVTDAENEI